MSSFFTKRQYKASRVLGSVEYLERPSQLLIYFEEYLTPDIATHIFRAEGLLMEYERTEVLHYLDDAAKALHTASDNIHDGGPHLASILSSYEVVLDLLYIMRGEIRGLELDLAVKVAERAVLATPEDDPDRPTRLGYLSNWVGRRFDWHGHIVDRDRAVEKAEEATKSSSTVGSSQAAALWNNLGFWLVRRFDHARNSKDLDRAVEASETAVSLSLTDGSLLAVRQHNLAVRRLKRFHENGLKTDITYCMEAARQAIKSPGILEFDRWLLLVNLGNIYLAQSEQTRPPNRHDIDEATDCFEKAVDDAAALCHHNYADCQLYLGECLMKRCQFVEHGEFKDRDNALQAFRNGWSCPRAQIWTRVQSARRAAKLLASQGNWLACSDLLGEAVDLLHLVGVPKNSDSARQHFLSNLQGLAAEAAAVALEAGKDAYDALNMVESGRSLMNNFTSDIDAFDDLGIQCPRMWDYGAKRGELDSFVIYILFPIQECYRRRWDDQIAKERSVRGELQDLVREIRMNPPWRTFLQLHSYEDLVSEANQGPMVVLNTTPYRCDAFVIETSGVSAFRLKNISLGEVQKRTRDLKIRSRLTNTLAWLWTSVARPIIHRLGFQTVASITDPPRVFWVLPGYTAPLPLHAAGYHYAGSTEAVIDKVMSTYCSSIKALIYGRRKRRVEFGGNGVDKALLVSMTETADLENLPYAPIEVAKVEQLCHSLNIRPTVLTLPTQSDLRRHFFDCKIFHFAGHALTDPINPLASCLCARDWVEKPVTVERLMHDFRVNLNYPFLAYLSACSTGAIEDDNLADESLHLIAVCQQSHFRHVVGCLSSVLDQHCVEVAELVYKTLRERGITDWSICFGLHCALRSARDAERESISAEPERKVKELRDGRISPEDGLDDYIAQPELENALHWVPYVHFGV